MAFSRENYGSSIFDILIEYPIEVPDGGDGGDGGDVYFRSSGRLSSLYDLRRAHFYGNDGKYGLVSLISIQDLNFNILTSHIA
jgi:GTPase involved in cell partitioning and DNA repair